MDASADVISSNAFIDLILQGGSISTAILVILLIMSVLSWTVIGWRWVTLNVAKRNAVQYLQNLDLLNGLSDAIVRSESYSSTYYAKEFQAAYSEYSESHKLAKLGTYYGDKQDLLLRIERSIEQCIVNENIQLEKNLTILATISSSAPFIGLFGTVTGIIDAFYSIGSQGAASIAVVAPGISAALVATAFGLFAAIPALISYNAFRNKTRIMREEMEAFALELTNMFDREFSKSVLIRKRKQQSSNPKS